MKRPQNNLTNTLRPVQCIPTLRTIKCSAYKSEILDYASLVFDRKQKKDFFMGNNDGFVLSFLKASTTLWSWETTAEKRWGNRRLSPCGYRPDSKHNGSRELYSLKLFKCFLTIWIRIRGSNYRILQKILWNYLWFLWKFLKTILNW